jgi:hypothetical protein
LYYPSYKIYYKIWYSLLGVQLHQNLNYSSGLVDFLLTYLLK